MTLKIAQLVLQKLLHAQLLRHGVEGLGEASDLIAPLVGEPHRQVARRHVLGSAGKLPQGLAEAVQYEERDKEHDEQRYRSNNKRPHVQLTGKNPEIVDDNGRLEHADHLVVADDGDLDEIVAHRPSSGILGAVLRPYDDFLSGKKTALLPHFLRVGARHDLLRASHHRNFTDAGVAFHLLDESFQRLKVTALSGGKFLCRIVHRMDYVLNVAFELPDDVAFELYRKEQHERNDNDEKRRKNKKQLGLKTHRIEPLVC